MSKAATVCRSNFKVSFQIKHLNSNVVKNEIVATLWRHHSIFSTCTGRWSSSWRITLWPDATFDLVTSWRLEPSVERWAPRFQQLQLWRRCIVMFVCRRCPSLGACWSCAGKELERLTLETETPESSSRTVMRSSCQVRALFHHTLPFPFYITPKPICFLFFFIAQATVRVTGTGSVSGSVVARCFRPIPSKLNTSPQSACATSPR